MDRDGRRIWPDREGYSLSLNGLDANGGLVACRDLGLLDAMLRHAGIWDAGWAELMRISVRPHTGLPTAAIRIMRANLRDTLIAAAEETTPIEWGTTCTAAECLADGRIRVHLAARSDKCDLLVAADGAHSKMRASFRPDDGLRYAGAVQMDGVGRFPAGIPPPVDVNWGMVVTGQGIGCFFSPVDETGVVWGLNRREPERTTRYDRKSRNDFEVLQREALDLGRDIGEPLATIVKATEQQSSIMPARDKEPFAHDTGPRNDVFVGDSNHVVSPFAGNGANLALNDGWDLASQLCAGSSFDEAIAAYDKLALPRAVKTLKTLHERIGFAHYTGVSYYIRVKLWFGSWFLWLTGR